MAQNPILTGSLGPDPMCPGASEVSILEPAPEGPTGPMGKLSIRHADVGTCTHV